MSSSSSTKWKDTRRTLEAHFSLLSVSFWQLLLTSGSLFQYLQVNYDAKIDSDATPADDIEAALKPHLAPGELDSFSLPSFPPIHVPPSFLVFTSSSHEFKLLPIHPSFVTCPRRLHHLCCNLRKAARSRCNLVPTLRPQDWILHPSLGGEGACFEGKGEGEAGVEEEELC